MTSADALDLAVVLRARILGAAAALERPTAESVASLAEAIAPIEGELTALRNYGSSGGHSPEAASVLEECRILFRRMEALLRQALDFRLAAAALACAGAGGYTSEGAPALTVDRVGLCVEG